MTGEYSDYLTLVPTTPAKVALADSDIASCLCCLRGWWSPRHASG